MLKPILFNSAMVKAILEGRKTVTRRLIKGKTSAGDTIPIPHDVGYIGIRSQWHEWEDTDNMYHVRPPFLPGDILYVRETFYKDTGRYMYKADSSDTEKFYRNGKEVQIKWRPSIHMHKEAARLFLKVTSVDAQRLHDILRYPGEVAKEGIPYEDQGDREASGLRFKELWDSTVSPADQALCGWKANPWVWVFRFERINKTEAMKEVHTQW